MEFPKYSVVIPAYNESARIPATLASVVAAIRANGWDAEVIVVNDGSTDSTAQLVRDFAGSAPEVRLLENPGNRGKGYSVRAGVLNAQGDIIMFTDADLSAPMEEAGRLPRERRLLRKRTAIAIPSKRMPRSLPTGSSMAAGPGTVAVLVRQPAVKNDRPAVKRAVSCRDQL